MTSVIQTVEEEETTINDCDKCRVGYINYWWFLAISLPTSIVTLVLVLFLLENTKVGVPWYLSRLLIKREDSILVAYNPPR